MNRGLHQHTGKPGMSNLVQRSAKGSSPAVVPGQVHAAIGLDRQKAKKRCLTPFAASMLGERVGAQPRSTNAGDVLNGFPASIVAEMGGS
jgi:hypothetical protein